MIGSILLLAFTCVPLVIFVNKKSQKRRDDNIIAFQNLSNNSTNTWLTIYFQAFFNNCFGYFLAPINYLGPRHPSLASLATISGPLPKNPLYLSAEREDLPPSYSSLSFANDNNR